MHSQTTPPPALDDMLTELAEYIALLDDMAERKRMDDTTLSADGMNGLNRLLRHMRGLAVEALGSVPTR